MKVPGHGIPVHVSSATDPRVRGESFGRTEAVRIRRECELYDGLFAALGVARATALAHASDCLEMLADWSPALAAELTGIASGSGVDLEWIAALNARTEILALSEVCLPGECSTVVARSDTGPWGVQTWDWYSEFATGATEWQVQTQARSVRTFTEVGVLGKVGVAAFSGSGIAVHLTYLRHVEDGQAPGVPVHAVARRVLDEARDLDDAIDIATSARVGASTSLTLLPSEATRGRFAATVELSSAGTAILERRGEFAVITNHFQSASLAHGDLLVSQWPDTLSRARVLEDRLRTRVRLPLRDNLTIHTVDGAPVCLHEDQALAPTVRQSTLAVLETRPALGSLRCLEGGPCQLS